LLHLLVELTSPILSSPNSQISRLISYLRRKIKIKPQMKKYPSTVVALCLGLVALSQEAVDFRLNLEIGKPLHIDMQMKTDIADPQEAEMDMAIKMEMRMEMVSTNKEEGNFTIENTTKNIKMDMRAGDMAVSYNSEEGSADEQIRILGEQLQKLIGQTVVLVVTEKGETLNVDLPEGFAGQGFDKTSFSNIATVFPDKPILPGESWHAVTTTTDNPVFTKSAIVSTYREESAEGHVVDIVGTISDASGNEVGTLSGHYVLDRTTHFTKSSVTKTTIGVMGKKVTNTIALKVD